MRKFLYTAAAAVAALALSSTAANAVALVVSPAPAPPGVSITPPATATFGNTFGGNGAPPVANNTAIHDVFTFTIQGLANTQTDAQLGTILLNGLQNVDFGCATCSIFIDTNVATNTFNLVTGSNPEVWALMNPITLTPGTHNLFVNGNITTGPTAGYSGTINFNLAAVPEPATWGLMLLGFLGIGMAVRRSRSPVLAQVA
jgi:hypothetical protein